MASKKVFINCPFDNRYFILLKPLLFTLIYLELDPQISETSDCGRVRINKINRMLKKSRFSIHDLSRMEPLKKGDLPRFNMPFECGIDFGMKYSGDKSLAKKKFLILEKKRYRYQKVISDISGNDIKAHSNKPEKLIRVVRDWYTVNKGPTYFSREIWFAYIDFSFHYDHILKLKGCDPNDIFLLTFKEIINYMTTWINGYKTKKLR
jgi:hypothetical protein